jgi:HNH endonuclease
MAKIKDITGLRFGKLVAIRPTGLVDSRMRWLCYCDCGGTIIVRLNNLQRGTQACGCGKTGPRYSLEKLRCRFEKRCMPEPNSGCLIWMAACDPQGYGVISHGRRQWRATHVALLLVGRTVPPGMHALHRCDNSYCVNPDHLFFGTNVDNARDREAKGRGRWRNWKKAK